MKIRQFGKTIPNLKIYGRDAPYKVLNERDTRAAAGIMLIGGIIAFTHALFLKDYTFLYLFVILFTIEFGIRVLINPNFAPFYALGSFVVRKQIPEYSGATQKRFAWSLGFLMALSMIVIAIIYQIRGILPFAICLTCLLLLWLESSFGICVGCKMYSYLIKLKIIKEPKVKPACPGGICELK